jgi:hypothetical protein
MFKIKYILNFITLTAWMKYIFHKTGEWQRKRKLQCNINTVTNAIWIACDNQYFNQSTRNRPLIYFTGEIDFGPEQCAFDPIQCGDSG